VVRIIVPSPFGSVHTRAVGDLLEPFAHATVYASACADGSGRLRLRLTHPRHVMPLDRPDAIARTIKHLLGYPGV
jgi:hypothetical protein